jgi:hypothetical protein
MKRLRDKVLVERPSAEAQSRLGEHFRALRDASGAARLHLRVPVKGMMGGLGLALDREVDIEAQQTRDDDNLNDVIRIRWNAEGNAAFPQFHGVLTVWGEDDPRSSYIELDGEYKPPLGVAGEAFDEVLGHQMAQATARELLDDLKRAIERD